VGFAADILFMIVLGFLFLGPKRLPTILGHVARAKAQFERATRSLKSQLEAEFETEGRRGKTEASQPPVGNQ
jgi:Sec-independent protein translocase protein TatA